MNSTTKTPKTQSKTPETQSEPSTKKSPQKDFQLITNFWTRMLLVLGIPTLLGGAYLSPLWLIGLVPMRWAVGKIQASANAQRKLEIAQRVTQKLTQRFTEQGIEIFDQFVKEKQPVDFFLRFPNKKFFLVSLKAVTKGTIFYNERIETICLKRASGLTKYNRPDIIQDSKYREIWLRKNRRDLFGGSSRDARRPVIRVLVFAQDAKIIRHHDHLYETIGEKKFLRISNSNGVIYLILEANICDFIQAHLG